MFTLRFTLTLSVAILSLATTQAEEAYHCSHCKRLATQWLAAEANPKGAPSRKYAPDRHVGGVDVDPVVVKAVGIGQHERNGEEIAER